MEENLFNWYNFKSNSKILEVEPYTKKISQYFEKLKGITLDVTNDVKEKTLTKYDYVIIYNPKYIEIVKDFLNEDGIILLATNNKFAVSYFVGGAYNGKLYDVIQEENTDLFTKNEIINLINKNGLKYYKFYYPLPNYKEPNAIFSDKYIPTSNNTKLLYNTRYQENSNVLFDELKLLKQLTKNNLFDMFTNSFLVEISLTNKLEEAKFISFNNNRKEKYQLITIIYEDRVEKKIVNKLGYEHIKNIKSNIQNLKQLDFDIIDYENNNMIISPFINENTFDIKIVNEIKNKNIDNALNLISLWYEYIKQKLVNTKKSEINSNINANKSELEGLTILKNCYIDLVFENTFFIDNHFKFFDQEWNEKGLPLEFILYRAIHNLFSYNFEINQYINMKDMLDKFDLTKNIELFEKIEKYLQTNIIDETKNEINQKSLLYLRDINGILQQLENYKQNDIKQNEYIKALEADNKNKQDYIEKLESEFLTGDLKDELK